MSGYLSSKLGNEVKLWYANNGYNAKEEKTRQVISIESASLSQIMHNFSLIFSQEVNYLLCSYILCHVILPHEFCQTDTHILQ